MSVYDLPSPRAPHVRNQSKTQPTESHCDPSRQINRTRFLGPHGAVPNVHLDERLEGKQLEIQPDA